MPRRLDVETAQRRHQRHRRRRDDRRVEGVAHGDAHGLHPGGGERSIAASDGGGRAADDGLVVRVDVGDHDVARVSRRRSARSRSAVRTPPPSRRCPRPTAPPSRDRERSPLPGRFERERTGGDRARRTRRGCGPSPCRVASRRRPSSRVMARVGRQHRRLGDLGLQQLLLEFGDGRRVVGVDEDVRRRAGGRAAASSRRRPRGTCRRRSARSRADPCEHVDVLRALAGVEERHLRRGAAPDEHALLAQHAEERRVVPVEMR